MAEEVALGRRVVVKVLPPDLAAGVSAERFRREIQLAAQLQHPGIVPLLTAGADGDLLWYVMPYVEGESLRTRLARGPLPVDDAVRLWRDVLEALEYAHGRGIVHRDIKPENIMLTGRRAVTLDFGVAKAVSASTSGGGTTTGVGFVVGTPAYMAPEQAAGDSSVDARADLYAAGLVMYEMLAGRGPFEARTPAEWMAAHIATAPSDVQSARAELPAALANTVMACLAKAPDARPASSHAVLGQLDSVARVSATPGSPLRGRPSRQNRRFAGGALLLVPVVAVVAALLRGRTDQAIAESARTIAELPDSLRLQVAFLPVISDPQDSILARSLVSAQIRSLQDDRRVLLQTPDRIREVAADIGLPVSTPDSLRQLYRDLGVHAYVQHTLARSGTGLLLVAEGFATRTDSALFRFEAAMNSVAELSEKSGAVVRDASTALIAAHGRVERPSVSGRLFGTTPIAATLYLEAGEAMRMRNHLRAVELLRRALAADSTFAMAWRRLEAALGNGALGYQERFTAAQNAMRWRDRLPSQRGRAYLEIVDLRARGDLDGALARAKDALREYPNDPSITNIIGNIYTEQRKPDLALRMYSEAFTRSLEERQSSPLTANYYYALADNGRFADLRSAIDRLTSALGGTDAMAYVARSLLASATLQSDSLLAVGREQLTHFKSDRERLDGYNALAHGMRLAGRIDSSSAFERKRRAILIDEQQASSAVGSVSHDLLLRATLLGDVRNAKVLLDTTLKSLRWDTLPVLDREYDRVILARIALGELTAARGLLEKWQRSVPSILAKAQGWRIAAARGEIALAAGEGQAALNDFRAADAGACQACAFMRFARAFDTLAQHDSVIFWYERALSSNVARLAVRGDEIPRAYRRLGELYEAKGDAKRAIQRYSDFVALWKNADPALQPLVKDVRERIARLQRKAG